MTGRIARIWHYLLIGMFLAGFMGCVSSHDVTVKGMYAEPEGCVPRNFFFSDIPNFRDLGGWETVDGRKVRQGRVFRSACFNERWRWYRSNASRDHLTERTRAYVTGTLGVRTDLDLRKEISCRGMAGSPLGEQVRFINISSKAYGDLASNAGREAFAKVFRVFLDESNYPILFHCAAGQDRAGSVAFILNGLLGVPLESLVKDWEMSRLWNGRDDFTYERKLSKLVGVFDAYEGETLQERIESYVRSLGFTEKDIVAFRNMMLVK